jgi:hypothetical protein
MTGALARFERRIAQGGRAPIPLALSRQDEALLHRLRLSARRARLASRIDLDRACALIAPEPEQAAEVYGCTLLRALDAEAARPVVFHPGCAAPAGFDEMWLLRIVRLFQSGDEAGARFLIAGRVNLHARRKVAFLAARFAQSLPQALV